MEERLQLFRRDDGDWCVALDNTVLVAFSGRGARAAAERHKAMLSELLEQFSGAGLNSSAS